METANDLLMDDTQKGLFSKMIDIGIDHTVAKKIMSFWMFLESKGFEDVFKSILVANDNFLRGVCAEAEMAFAFLESKKNPLNPTSSIFVPNTWNFASSGLSPKDVFGDKEQVFKEILAFKNNVYDAAFQDISDKKGKKSNIEDPKVKKAGGEGSSEIHASKLNPSAKEWSPVLVPEEKRSLFMTFSKSSPLSKYEIIDYFRRQHGDCIQEVYIHKPRNKKPEFGKIVFKFSWIPNHILHNQESVILNIGEKTIGLKKYKL